MIKSMTGFARCRKTIGCYDISIDVKSVNHRYLDLNVRVPKYYSFLEDKIREQITNYITRGKIEINIYIRQIGKSEKKVSVNEALFNNYVDILKSLSEKLGTNDLINVNLISRFPDIFETEYEEGDEGETVDAFLSVFKECMEDFDKMRENEGARIKKDLDQRLLRVSEMGKEVEERAPGIVKDYRDRLYKKLQEIVGTVDDQRLLTEAAIYADKITTAEETVRLQSHIKEFNNMLSKNGAVGKKLDFLVQEMNREVNTTGSKCNDFETSKIVVELKSEIENIREQIQNIE